MGEEQKEKEPKQLTEIKKKSELSCKNSFDLGKLNRNEPYFLPMSYEEGIEEIIFTYTIGEMKPVEELKKEEKEKQYQFLINFGKMEKIYGEYKVSLSLDNLYYDENYLPYIKHRDLYLQGEAADAEEYLFLYKSFIGGILGKRFSVSQIQESGLEILKKEKQFKEYYDVNNSSDLVNRLREQKALYQKKQKETKVQVSRRGNRIKLFLAIAAPILMAASLALFLYDTYYVIPFQDSVIAANEAYISGDYVGCIDSMKTIGTERMDASTKYILAVSYARSESLKREEIASLIEKLKPYSNEKELEYWIELGRMETVRAEDLAQSLSDDKLLIYAYMKELNQLEGNTAISGEEKQARIAELEGNIQSLGEKYTSDDQ